MVIQNTVMEKYMQEKKLKLFNKSYEKTNLIALQLWAVPYSTL